MDQPPLSPWFRLTIFLLIGLYVADFVMQIKPNGDVPFQAILFAGIDLAIVYFAARGGCFSRFLFALTTLVFTLVFAAVLGLSFLIKDINIHSFLAMVVVASQVIVGALWFLHVVFLWQATARARELSELRRATKRRTRR